MGKWKYETMRERNEIVNKESVKGNRNMRLFKQVDYYVKQ